MRDGISLAFEDKVRHLADMLSAFALAVSDERLKRLAVSSISRIAAEERVGTRRVLAALLQLLDRLN